MKPLLLFLPLALLLTAKPALCQDTMNNLPYREIPAPPDSFTAETVVASMLDGLGYRYYWATEGLRTEDLDFRPTPESRTCFETLQHIFGHTESVLNVMDPTYKEKTKAQPKPESFEDIRLRSLQNLEAASNLLRQPDANLESYRFSASIPFWNAINGPIEDAVWHVGQVVTFRRSSGNPINPKADMFSGKVRE